jgi:hypothetical protein
MPLMSPPPICAEACPEAPVVTCRLAPGNHLEHFGGYGDEARSWPNPGYIAPRPEDSLTGDSQTKAKLMAMARRLRQAQ